MSRIHGLVRARTWWEEGEMKQENECYCGRVFYSEKEFREHVNNYG